MLLEKIIKIFYTNIDIFILFYFFKFLFSIFIFFYYLFFSNSINISRKGFLSFSIFISRNGFRWLKKVLK